MLASDKTTPVVFTGKAGEYFGIWIVNLLLSIVTLGIYSAWAKVRRKKYFYNNTLIDGVGFDYHATPISILKGRIIAFTLFVIYMFGGKVSPLIPPALAIVFMLFLPWIVVRAMTFNARNTSHRGLRFNFTGSVRSAVRVFIGLPLLIALTLGLIFPYIAHQRNQYLLSNHRFGISNFDFNVSVKTFYKIYLLALLILLSIGAVIGIAVAASMGGHFDETALKRAAPVMGIAFFIAYVFILLIPSAFIQARIGNAIWNTTRLDHLHFHSDMRARDLIALYVTNLLAIVVSFGLMTPWAHIRMARYRAEHLAVLGEADFDRFVGDKKAEAKATGEEIADMFDVDLAFG